MSSASVVLLRAPLHSVIVASLPIIPNANPGNTQFCAVKLWRLIAMRWGLVPAAGNW